MSAAARFWAVDVHVHTPGSSDAADEHFGSADDIVAAAVAVGLDAIAITDHNTADWCERVAAAASDLALVVLPGVEITTTEGHLLAIFEEDTSATVIRDLLVRIGIQSADHGKLDISAEVNLAQAAHAVDEAGGIAIPAHIDRPKGLLQIGVKAHLQKTLLDESLSAVEIVKRETEAAIESRVGAERTLACVRGSDTFDGQAGHHALSGIGARRTWIKASRPDLVGLRHALADPALRLRLDEPLQVDYPLIERVSFTGGFLDGQSIELSRDLNCLLGGTGSGKSLILEAVRYTLNQQVDAAKFPAIAAEVHGRLSAALGPTGTVLVQVVTNGQTYRITRLYGTDGTPPPTVTQRSGDDWAEVDVDPAEVIELAAFSQGEILEHAREPVGRMSLVDAGIDLGPVNDEIARLERELRKNAKALIAGRTRVRTLEASAAQTTDVEEQVRKLSTFFDTETVKSQGSWSSERQRLGRAKKAADEVTVPSLAVPNIKLDPEVEANKDTFEKANTAMVELRAGIAAGLAAIETARAEAIDSLATLSTQWELRFVTFKKSLDDELEKVDAGESLTALRGRLEDLQAKLLEAQSAKTELETEARPGLEGLWTGREDMLKALHDRRHERRELRRGRVAALNGKMSGQVKLDVPNYGDFKEFRGRLEVLKVGSRLKDEVLAAIAKYRHPVRFGRSLWKGDVNELVDETQGIDAASIARFLSNIDERDLWSELLETQLVDRPDVLTVTFKKPQSDSYTPIENLAHGQKCTAILIILLADGATPVLVDQPEDALHAPWIEEYLVERLRDLRGSRQYLFPTRSPGIVVSADAEQIVTLSATAGRSEVEAVGSLERHDLNKLALFHLEGGPVPFKRRTKKLAVSTER
jgi:AAA domain/PHP domain